MISHSMRSVVAFAALLFGTYAEANERAVSTHTTPASSTQRDTKNDPKADARSDANTGSQTVTVTPIQVIKKTVYRTKTRVKKVRVYVYRPNSVQLLVGASKTRLVVEEDSCCSYRAGRKYERDVGIQYSRDFGRFTGSIVGTMNRGLYVGIGINW